MRSASRAYILVFDRMGPDEVYLKLHAAIKSSKSFVKWWHYLTSCYLLISERPLEEIMSEIRNILKDDSFLLMEVNLSESNGWLPKKAWDWITRNSETQMHMAS